MPSTSLRIQALYFAFQKLLVLLGNYTVGDEAEAFSKTGYRWVWCLVPISPATWKAEIGRTGEQYPVISAITEA
jgi:hypothetical protein